MKKPIIYILSIIFFVIGVYCLKIYLNNDNIISANYQIDLESNTEIKAEIEILNGCGELGVANLYSNFLIQRGFDIIDSKNADNFDYLNTNILVHKKNKMDIAKGLAKILKIKDIKLSEGGMWDLSLIIGKDYKELDSFKTIKKYYPPF